MIYTFNIFILTLFISLPTATLLPAMARAQGGPPGGGGGQRHPTAAVMSPDASLVAAQADRDITVWSAASGKVLAVVKGEHFFRGAVAAGTLLAVRQDGIEARWGKGFARKVKLKAPRAMAMGRTSLSANGRVAAAIYPRDGGISDPDTAGVFDTRSGRRLGEVRLRPPRRVQGAVLSADGKRVAVFGDIRGKKALVEVHRVLRRGLRLLFRHETSAQTATYSAALSPDGRLLALGADERLLLFDLAKKRLLRQAATSAVKALFPPPLRGPSVRMPGCHQLAFSADGKRLASLHVFSVVGVSSWSVDTLRPTAWIKRPRRGGPMRQLAWDREGRLWLISATYAPDVWLYSPRGDRFQLVRTLSSSKTAGARGK